MSADEGPLRSPGFWLHHAALTWRAELDARLRPLGLTPTQFMLLGSAGWLEPSARRRPSRRSPTMPAPTG